MSLLLRPLGWGLVAAILAWLAVAAMCWLARRRGLLDLPGRRRSHQQPTPRGGGMGMMLVLLLLLPWVGLPAEQAISLSLALAAVAGIGAWDDVRPLGVRQRLLVQLGAVALLNLVWLGNWPAGIGLALLLLPVGVWSINLHNFMDGIDGLLAGHTLVIAGGLALLAAMVGQLALASGAMLLVGVSAAFLCFNWAPARIFMGDAGSGGCGLLLYGLGLALVVVRPNLIWAVLTLSSSFAIDAGLTLLSRIWRGRAWTQPHREHLYQWQVRRGGGHARVSLAFMSWDLLITVWVLISAANGPLAMAGCLLSYLLAAAVWLQAKRQALRRRRELR